MKTVLISMMALPVIVLVSCSKSSNHSSSSLSSNDSAFAVKASQANIAEIEAGQVSLSNSQDDSVQTFGQMMIDDHSKAKKSLDSIGDLLHFNMPDAADATHAAKKMQLMNLHGLAFDSTYVNGQVADHKTVLAMLGDEMSNGTNAMLKNYASKNYPIVQMHLQMADSLQVRVSK